MRMYLRTTNRARRFARESARVCFENKWQPMRSRRCANEHCACAKSYPSFADFREVTIDSRSLGTDLEDTVNIIKSKSFLVLLIIHINCEPIKEMRI